MRQVSPAMCQGGLLLCDTNDREPETAGSGAHTGDTAYTYSKLACKRFVKTVIGLAAWQMTYDAPGRSPGAFYRKPGGVQARNASNREKIL